MEYLLTAEEYEAQLYSTFIWLGRSQDLNTDEMLQTLNLSLSHMHCGIIILRMH